MSTVYSYHAEVKKLIKGFMSEVMTSISQHVFSFDNNKEIKVKYWEHSVSFEKGNSEETVLCAGNDYEKEDSNLLGRKAQNSVTNLKENHLIDILTLSWNFIQQSQKLLRSFIARIGTFEFKYKHGPFKVKVWHSMTAF